MILNSHEVRKTCGNFVKSLKGSSPRESHICLRDLEPCLEALSRLLLGWQLMVLGLTRSSKKLNVMCDPFSSKENLKLHLLCLLGQSSCYYHYYFFLTFNRVDNSKIPKILVSQQSQLEVTEGPSQGFIQLTTLLCSCHLSSCESQCPPESGRMPDGHRMHAFPYRVSMMWKPTHNPVFLACSIFCPSLITTRTALRCQSTPVWTINDMLSVSCSQCMCEANTKRRDSLSVRSSFSLVIKFVIFRQPEGGCSGAHGRKDGPSELRRTKEAADSGGEGGLDRQRKRGQHEQQRGLREMQVQRRVVPSGRASECQV